MGEMSSDVSAEDATANVSVPDAGVSDAPAHDLAGLREDLAVETARRRLAEAQRDHLQEELESALQAYAKARQELESIKGSRAYRLFRETSLRVRRRRDS